MQVETFSFDDFEAHGGLFVDFLKARRRQFVEIQKWDLPVVRGMEFDQYDTPHAVYIVARDDDGKVVGGKRFLPTTARNFGSTYMLKDAQDRVLDGFPEDILYEKAPVDETIWETTRVFAADWLSQEERNRVRLAVTLATDDLARDRGISHFIAVTSLFFQRAGKQFGLNMTPIGPRFGIEGETSQALSYTVDRSKVERLSRLAERAQLKASRDQALSHKS